MMGSDKLDMAKCQFFRENCSDQAEFFCGCSHYLITSENDGRIIIFFSIIVRDALLSYSWGPYLLPHQFLFQSDHFSILPHILSQICITNHYHYLYPPPTTFSVPKRNKGKCFERPAKILRELQIFGKNLGGVGGGGGGGGGGRGVLTIWF